MRYLRSVCAIIAKDIAVELHSGEILGSMLVYSVSAALIFGFALDLRPPLARAAAPGILWATTCFAGTLGLSRSMGQEVRSGGLDGLLLAPVDRTAIFFGKAAANLLLMLAVEALLLPLFFVLFDTPVLRANVILVMTLGTIGYAGIGTMLAAMAVATRAREVLLPVLLLPLAIPALIAAVKATTGLLEEGSLEAVARWTGLLVAYDLVVVAVAVLAFGYLVED